MITTIDKTHKIFSDSNYQNDIVPFNLMEVIKQAPILLVSNEKSFIMGMTSLETPVWIWTAETIENSEIEELCECFYDQFKEKTHVDFVAKPDIADILIELFTKNNYAVEHCIKMQSFENTKLIPPKDKGIIVEKPDESDIGEIAVCTANFEHDCFGRAVSPESRLETARERLNNPYFFVIKQNGRVVATAKCSRETVTHISVNQVYTQEEHRGKGYATALVAHISSLILEKGKTPALYTDLANPFSNKAYKNVGFIEKGRVNEVSLSLC